MEEKNKTKKFVDDSIKIHGCKYDYSESVYKNTKTPVKIKCHKHGFFSQTPHAHIYRCSGCKKCSIEKRSEFLIQKTNQNKFIDLIQPYDHKIIPLSKGKFAIVDNDDFDRLKNINWAVNRGGYAVSTRKGLMHRFIMNPSKEYIIDHKNRNTLDNRKSNLRICLHSENGMNSVSRKKSRSKYKGVYWIKERKTWRALITLKNKTFYIGYFKDEIEAAKAYDKKAIELFGEFALLNFKNK